MRLPAPLLRKNPHVHKNNFGHCLILAGSPSMLGAACLTALSAMRAGAGLTTVGIPKHLNLTLQKKISSVVMTLPLPETKEGTLSAKSFPNIQKFSTKCQALAIGPGLTNSKDIQILSGKIIKEIQLPIVIDADGLNALSTNTNILKNHRQPIILTPHPGEIQCLCRRCRE